MHRQILFFKKKGRTAITNLSQGEIASVHLRQQGQNSLDITRIAGCKQFLMQLKSSGRTYKGGG